MRIFVNTKVVHLESLHYLRLYDNKRWLKQDMLKHPENKDTNVNKIRLINQEINKRDLLPLTNSQKKVVAGAKKFY